MNRALFLDRDGTLVHRKDYPRVPEDLVLFDGIGAALKRCQDAGWKLVVITNQGGIALGYFDVPRLEAMHEYLAQQLARDGVIFDGIYSCPHHPKSRNPALQYCMCRKPKPGMLLMAARDLDIDLAASWMIGDMASDIEAGEQAGCFTALVGADLKLGTWSWMSVAPAPDIVALTTVEVLDQIYQG